MTTELPNDVSGGVLHSWHWPTIPTETWDRLKRRSPDALPALVTVAAPAHPARRLVAALVIPVLIVALVRVTLGFTVLSGGRYELALHNVLFITLYLAAGRLIGHSLPFGELFSFAKCVALTLGVVVPMAVWHLPFVRNEWLLLFSIVLGAVTEETIFRSILPNQLMYEMRLVGFKHALHPVAAILASQVVFVFAHGVGGAANSLTDGVYLYTAGLVLAALVRAAGVSAGAIAHAMINLGALGFSGSIFQTGTSGALLLWFSAASGVLLLHTFIVSQRNQTERLSLQSGLRNKSQPPTREVQ